MDVIGINSRKGAKNAKEYKMLQKNLGDFGAVARENSALDGFSITIATTTTKQTNFRDIFPRIHPGEKNI